MKNSLRSTISIITMLLSVWVTNAQDIKLPKQKIPVQYDSYYAYVELLEEDKIKKVDNTLFYYWLKAKEIHISRGGYEGKLLHGEYSAFYNNDNIKEQGHFNKGLKHGTWKEWFPSGEMKSMSEWKNGMLHGTVKYYDEYGKLVSCKQYKNDKAHGKHYTCSDSAMVITRYRNGKEIKTKPKKRKTRVSKKPKTKNTEEIKKEEAPAKNKTRKLKKKDTTPEKENEKQETPATEKKKRKVKEEQKN